MSAAGIDHRPLQYAFAAHLRDPEGQPMPEGLEDRRVAIYRELFYNNVESLLSGNFPVIRSLLPKATWHALVRDFYREHASHTPLFTEIGREFSRYLQARAERGAGDPPFLSELAHYEFVELAVALDEADIATIAHDPEGDVVRGAPVVSPLARLLVYRFPVHRIRADYQPHEAPAEATCLIVARNRRDEVGFMETSMLSLKLIELLKENPGATGLECVGAIAEVFEATQRDGVIAAGSEILRGLRARDVLLGTRTD